MECYEILRIRALQNTLVMAFPICVDCRYGGGDPYFFGGNWYFFSDSFFGDWSRRAPAVTADRARVVRVLVLQCFKALTSVCKRPHANFGHFSRPGTPDCGKKCLRKM